MTLSVVVPLEQSELCDRIIQGSGIVASPYRNTGKLRLDFEGNRYGLPEFSSFADRVQRAAERHLAHVERDYSTSSCAYVDPSAVVKVGEFDIEEGKIIVGEQEALMRWLDVSRLDERELTVSERP